MTQTMATFAGQLYVATVKDVSFDESRRFLLFRALDDEYAKATFHAQFPTYAARDLLRIGRRDDGETVWRKR